MLSLLFQHDEINAANSVLASGSRSSTRELSL